MEEREATVEEIKVCSNCENWEKDPIPYNNIYFGVCRLDGRIKCEFHKCDYYGKSEIF